MTALQTTCAILGYVYFVAFYVIPGAALIASLVRDPLFGDAAQ